MFLHQSSGALYTLRYNNGAWGGLVQQTVQPWIAVAGANFEGDRDPPYEHDVFSDDCRRQNQTCYPDPTIPGYCFRAQTINFAEVLYNEARGETVGAQGLVGWTIRNRARQSLKNNCDSYPGAEGGDLTDACRRALPCIDPYNCELSKKDCCAIHGGTINVGAPQSQFNDEHVPFTTLYDRVFLYRAVHILNGWIPDVSTGFIPGGVNRSSCNTHDPPVYPDDCRAPFCSRGSNSTQASPGGPVEFRSRDYRSEVSGMPQYAPTCKTWKGDICGNTPPEPGSDNYFFNRTP